EMLAAHLTEPWLILRVISGVMDRPAEAYVAGSELSSFGERVLADIDRRLAVVEAFNPAAGRAAAQAAADAVHLVTAERGALEQSIGVPPDVAGGRRTAHRKRTLAAAVEARLKGADGAVARALPLQTKRMGPRAARGIPRLTHDPDPVEVVGQAGDAAG